MLLSAVADAVAEESLEANTTSSASDDTDGWQCNGYVRESYRFRYATAPEVTPSVLDSPEISSGDLRRGADHDLTLYLGAGLQDTEDRFAADLSMGLYADLDGFVPAGDPSPFASQRENGNDVAAVKSGTLSSLRIDVYSLNTAYRSNNLLGLVRLGRQVSEHGRFTTFDGGALDLHLLRPYLDLFVYGGRSIHFFETDDALYEDWLASAGLVIRPAPLLRFELDYRFSREDIPTREMLIGGNENATSTVVGHEYGILGLFHYGEWLYIKAYFRGIGNRPSHAGGLLSLSWHAIELGLDVKGDAQLTTLTEINESMDAYYAILGESLPHLRLAADLWKTLTTDAVVFGAHFGVASRFLTTDAPTPYNRDFGRVYLSLEASDIGTKGLFVNTLGELHFTYKNSAPRDRFFTAGGQAGYENDIVRLEAGSYYQWYKYDYYRDVSEKVDVRTYFATLAVTPAKWIDIRLRYELEQLDRWVHTATLTLAERF